MPRQRKQPQIGQAVQLPLFGAEYAAQVIEKLPKPTAATALAAANIWFSVHLSALDYSLNTIDSYTTSVELLARFLGNDYPLEKIGNEQLRRYLDWLQNRDGQTPVKTLALRVTGLRKFFQTLVDEQVLAKNPAEELYAPVGNIPLPEVLTPIEEEHVRRIAEDYYASNQRRGARPLLLLLLTLDLGLRRGELENLALNQVDTSQPDVLLRIHYKERRHRYKNRTLVAPPNFRQVYRDYLRQYPPEGDLVFTASRRTLHRVLERLGKGAGTTAPVTPMVLRWNCALHWYKDLAPEDARQRLGLSPIGWEDAERVLRALAEKEEKQGLLPEPGSES